ncbi:MAG: MFS transporter, partial [Clostridia bacterium]|nr:MFS transporter [Clostridia bacterium]
LASSILWPGCFSLASSCFPKGGTTLFGLLAFFGDLGCSFGPYIAGIVADLVKTYTKLGDFLGATPEQAGLKAGIFISGIFPLVLLVCIKRIKPSKFEN